MKSVAGIIFLIFTLAFTTESALHVPEKNLGQLLTDYAKWHYPESDFRKFIYVSVRQQEICFIRDSIIVVSYPVSTSKFGTGSELNSEKTPLGLHRIHSILGDDAPLNGVITKSGYSGKKAEIISEPFATKKDLITTRAFRLEGMEKGKNKGGNRDSFKRDIFLHGTHEEGLIGQPASHGCIRMKNNDVLELSRLVETGTPVLILNY